MLLYLSVAGINGKTLLKHMGNANSALCVIMRTASQTIASAIETLKNNAFDYVRKPIEFESFKKIVEAALRKQGYRRNRETEINQSLVQKIRGLRLQKELPLNQLAVLSNLSVSLISQIERAESAASLSSLYKIATALNVRIADFFEEL